uniref:Uncharacterized protein n=1 Tax=uncultured marine virus TaxID=186617 RepID=A0A0F7L7I1_9VIRU|nr:hypothetical protein [uncultured marine virus]
MIIVVQLLVENQYHNLLFFLLHISFDEYDVQIRDKKYFLTYQNHYQNKIQHPKVLNQDYLQVSNFLKFLILYCIFYYKNQLLFYVFV